MFVSDAPTLHKNETYCKNNLIILGQETSCGAVLNEQSGWFCPRDLNNDGYTDAYIDCYWTILAEMGNVVQLEFQSLDIENSQCSKDYLKVSTN